MTNKRRVAIQGVGPEVDCGRYAIKRVLGEQVVVQAVVFAEGHDRVFARLLYRQAGQEGWQRAAMEAMGNDRWEGSFVVEALGYYEYTVEGWVDRFGTWQEALEKKYDAGQAVGVELTMGAALLGEAAARVGGEAAKELAQWAEALVGAKDENEAVAAALSEEVGAWMREHADEEAMTRYGRRLRVWVDRALAGFSTWYELFPRSCGRGAGKHGTLQDVAAELERVAQMGFDVLYLPPIHPIGRTNRKGRNNVVKAGAEDPGSPWAIGGPEGGHKAIHPALGTVEDFRELVKRTRGYGLEVAMDLAFQCTPDHPYVQEHPEWFRWRPDGTVQYAENPPKKYEDILPINFETEDWRALWEELKSVVVYWLGQGVRIFRVDNPHTKPFAFWEWLIEEVRREHPEVMFLAEAFTRPTVMAMLAKVGFTQSYTYFTWRNTAYELRQYMEELTGTGLAEYFRPNFWPNTPDILPQYLQYGGRAAFVVRLVLAGTLSSNYGIYGPAFERCEDRAVEGKEEYLDSDKYEIKDWSAGERPDISAVVERVNRARRENAALQRTNNVVFCECENEMLLAYCKVTEDLSNIVMVVVNLDSHHRQVGWMRTPLEHLALEAHQPYLAQDVLSGDRYLWQGEWNYVELDPATMPAHVMVLRRRLRREMDFDYFM